MFCGDFEYDLKTPDCPKLLVIFAALLERFSFNRRADQDRANVITLANHSRRNWQRNEPIKTRGKCMNPAPSAGKRVRASYHWFGFISYLVEKVA